MFRRKSNQSPQISKTAPPSIGPSANYERALSLMQQEKFAEALLILRQAAQEYPQSYEAQTQISLALRRLEQPQEALLAAEREQ